MLNNCKEESFSLYWWRKRLEKLSYVGLVLDHPVLVCLAISRILSVLEKASWTPEECFGSFSIISMCLSLGLGVFRNLQVSAVQGSTYHSCLATVFYAIWCAWPREGFMITLYFIRIFLFWVKYTRGPSTCKEVSLRSINSQNAFMDPWTFESFIAGL
jgi:hypothetical protein